MNKTARKQSTTTYPIPFLLVTSIDHITGATGKTPTITIAKNGGSFGAAASGATEQSNGWYFWIANATDRDTLGSVEVHVTATGCDPVDFSVDILSYDPFAVLDANILQWRGTQPNVLQTGRVDSYVGEIANNVINAASIATDAITEIVTGVWTNTTRTLSDGAITAVTFAANALDAVWSTTSRTLTSYGTLVADIAVAVWTYVTRTITSGGVTASEVADAVWNRLTSAITTVGSIGKYIQDSLASILIKVNLITSGTTVTIVSPIAANQTITIISGDDYYQIDNRALTFDLSGFPSIVGGTAKLKVNTGQDFYEITGTIVDLDTCYFELPTATTSAMKIGTNWKYDVEITLSNGHIITPVQGTFIVRPDQED